MEQNKIFSVDSYIESIPVSLQTIFIHVRKWICECAPNATETIIYGMPSYVYYGTVVHFAHQKKHLGFYPGPSGVLYALSLNPNLQYSKGTIRFPYTEEVPYQLIKDVIEFRLKENEQAYLMKQSMKKPRKK